MSGESTLWKLFGIISTSKKCMEVITTLCVLKSSSLNIQLDEPVKGCTVAVTSCVQIYWM